MTSWPWMDRCLNFFAGSGKSDFSASINFYNIHYAFPHIVGTSCGNTEDMHRVLEIMESGRLNPAAIEDFEQLGEEVPHLAEITKRNDGL